MEKNIDYFNMEQQKLEKEVSISHINISISDILDRMDGKPMSKTDLERIRDDYGANVEILDYELAKGATLNHPNLGYDCNLVLREDKLYYLFGKIKKS